MRNSLRVALGIALLWANVAKASPNYPSPQFYAPTFANQPQTRTNLGLGNAATANFGNTAGTIADGGALATAASQAAAAAAAAAAAQATANAALPSSQLGHANGAAQLDSNSLLLQAELPAIPYANLPVGTGPNTVYSGVLGAAATAAAAAAQSTANSAQSAAAAAAAAAATAQSTANSALSGAAIAWQACPAPAGGVITLTFPSSGSAAFACTITANVSIAIAGGSTVNRQDMHVLVTENSTGGYSITPPYSPTVLWQSGGPPLFNTTANSTSTFKIATSPISGVYLGSPD